MSGRQSDHALRGETSAGPTLDYEPRPSAVERPGAAIRPPLAFGATASLLAALVAVPMLVRAAAGLLSGGEAGAGDMVTRCVQFAGVALCGGVMAAARAILSRRADAGTWFGLGLDLGLLSACAVLALWLWMG